MNSVTFTAVFPAIQAAIRFHGEGGMRITLDIDESQVGEAAALLMWRGKVMKITVEEEEAWQPPSK